MTRLEGLTFLLPFLQAEHTCCLTAAILDFAKGAFFEANRGKNHTLYLYLPELLICVKGITEVVFYFVFSFTVKEGSKKGLKKERRPIANRQFLYQSSLLPHFLLHSATVTPGKIILDYTISILLGGRRGVMVKAMDCEIVVSGFVLQSRYDVHFRANTLGKGMNLLILPAMD